MGTQAGAQQGGTQFRIEGRLLASATKPAPIGAPLSEDSYIRTALTVYTGGVHRTF
jgi:hypothetical protein